MELTRLSLVITDKCNAACEFCGLSCGPDGQQVMDTDMMLRTIREAKDLGMETVEFSGGEPFLYPNLLEKGVTAARAVKLQTEIATNGFWGAWDDEKIHEALKALKPDSLNISADFFHGKFIPKDHVARAIRGCAEQGIRPMLYVADMEGAHSAGRYIFGLGDQRFGVSLRIYPVHRSGRAANMPEAWFLTANQRKGVGDRFTDTLSVFYNGDVYPCRPNEVFESAVKVGNVRETALRDIVNALGDSVIREARGNVQ